jgi:hypothetical protein
MSMTYNLVCPETKMAIWCSGRDHIYGTEQKLKLLDEWLRVHQDKAIYFVNDESKLLDDVEYKNWVGMEDDETPDWMKPPNDPKLSHGERKGGAK